MVNNSLGWATGLWRPTEKVLILKYEGVWRVHKMFNEYYNVYNIRGFSNGTAWTCANKNLNPPPSGEFLYFNAGNWETRRNPDPSLNVMIAIFFFDESNGWGVGSGGKIWRYKRNVDIKTSSLGSIKAMYY
jgi:hypothetical protein